MVFSSAVFLFIFLPVVLFVHTVVKNTTARNIFLLRQALCSMLSANRFMFF